MTEHSATELGFTFLELLLILVILSVVGLSGYVVWHSKQVADKALSPGNSTAPVYKNKAGPKTTPTAVDLYAEWKTYTSTVEKITFKYPSNWSLDSKDAWASNDPNNTDYIALKSPDGNVVVRWTSLTTGFDNTSGPSYPLNDVIDKSAIPHAPGDYVVSGTTTLDGRTYYPWIAVENNSDDGVLASGIHGDLDLFQGRNNIDATTGKPNTALFSTCGPRIQEGCSGSTRTQAIASLSSNDMYEAKLIFLSMSY